MAYASYSDVLNRYNPLKSMLGTGTMDINTPDISSIFIADAEGYMNSFLAKRYSVPVQTEPLITQICSDIAIYKILEDRAPRIPDFMEKRYTFANSLLMMLADGDIILTGSNQMVSSAGDQEAWSNVLENQQTIFKPAEAFSLSQVRSYWLP